MLITFLGTSASAPTKNRALSSICITFNGKNYLFDSPEGIQRQFMQTKLNYMKIDSIFLSHLHLDHTLGLAGILTTMTLYSRVKPLTIFGPVGIESFFENLKNLGIGISNFEINIVEVNENKVILDDKLFSVSSVELDHSTKCFGYIFVEKGELGKFIRENAIKLGVPIGPLFSKLKNGETITLENKKKVEPKDVLDFKKARLDKKVSIVFDTLTNEKYFEEIKNSDILIHESTFSKEETKRAIETKHSTALEVGKVAKKTNAKKLYLIHYSTRHKDNSELLKEAKSEFENTFTANEFEEIKL